MSNSLNTPMMNTSVTTTSKHSHRVLRLSAAGYRAHLQKGCVSSRVVGIGLEKNWNKDMKQSRDRRTEERLLARSDQCLHIDASPLSSPQYI
jgi:hypothetical protein